MAAPTMRRSSIVSEEVTPSLNAFIRNVAAKGEGLSYGETLGVFGSIKSSDPTSSEAIHRSLGRLMQYGHLQAATVPVMLAALTAAPSGVREDRSVTRLVHYLVQLALGNGAAGTPLPLPAAKAGVLLPKAVDLLSSEALSGAWADLASDKSSFPRKKAALRALAAVAHASLTLKPDDATYVAGLFYTLTSLLDKLEGMQKDKSTLSNFLARQGNKKKVSGAAELRTRLEMCALQRLAFSAARIALSRSGIVKIAMRSFSGVTSPDPLGARHALALAALAARDPSGTLVFIQELAPLLRKNVELAKRSGQLYAGVPAAPPQTTLQQLGVAVAVPAAAPVVVRDEPDNYVNLRDTWSRIYLARACAVAIQSGHIAGDVANRGAVFWDTLVVTACQDAMDLAALEAVRAMFGAPYPKAAPITGRAAKQTPHAEYETEAGQSKIYAASWHMIMSQADTEPAVLRNTAPVDLQAPTMARVGDKTSVAAALGPTPSMRITADAVVAKGTSDSSLFARITRRVIKCLQSKSRALIASACRTVAVVAEARAWCHTMSGSDEVLGSESVRRLTRQLQNYMAMVLGEDSLGACERAAAAEALLWLQLPDGQALVTPGQVVRAMASGGSTAPEIVRATFADPWPEALVSAFLGATMRRGRCAVALAEHCLHLAVAATAAAPSRIPRELLLQVLDGAPGPSAVRAAAEMLTAPLPPLTQPIGNSAVEVKHLACVEEAAHEGLKGQAAWWLGEHANQVAQEQAWKPRPVSQVALLPAGLAEAGEQLALAGAAQNPLLVTVMSHLQRAMLTGAWEVRLAAAQALAKVGVRASEPYRIQAYSLLASTQQMGTGEADPLGVAPVVAPALEVLDALYAGELVLDQLISAHGETPDDWPKPLLRSLVRRHEWLLTTISHKVCGVPRETFLALGPRSKALIRPDEKDAEANITMAVGHSLGEDAALAAAAAAAAEGADGDEQHYDAEGQYADYDYDYQDQYADEQYADPLEQYDGDAANGMGLQWGGVGGDSVSVSGTNTEAYDAHSDDESDARYGSAYYEFTPESDGEVALAAGERVRVHYDMGGWYHITNAAGASGLVPSSYIQLEDGYEDGSQPSQSLRKGLSYSASARGGDGTSEYGLQSPSSRYDEAQNYGNDYGDGDRDEYDAFGGHDNYYGGDYSHTDNYAASNNGNEEVVAPYTGGGGFDDFGSIFASATAARLQAQQQYQQQQQQQQQQQRQQRQQLQQQGSVPSPRSSVAVPASPVGSTVSNTTFVPTRLAPRASEEMQRQPSVLQPAPSVRQLSAAGSLAGSEVLPARGAVMYDFNAELDNELSVSAGEEVVLGREVDGWYQATRVSDGVSGLLPASYVQLFE